MKTIARIQIQKKTDEHYQLIAVALIVAAFAVVSMALVWQRKSLMLMGVQ